MSSPARSAYAAAGVDVAAGDRAVELLRQRLRRSPLDLLGGIGGFGAALALPAGYDDPVLVLATDGVGTKTDIARSLGRFDTIGRDVVAMCANDVVCHGARPLFFLDYLTLGRLDPERVAELVGGIADACAEIGCDLVGGETAEHPGVMAADAFDIGGFCVGIVERRDLIDGTAARPGDVVIGLESSGLHANGFSLVRRLIDDGRLPLKPGLLTPTRLYGPLVLRLRQWLRERELDLRGLAHVTGGGLAGNLPRAVGPGLGVRVQPMGWPRLDVFDEIQAAAGISDREMRATFNCGIGLAVVLEPAAVSEELFRWLNYEQRIEAWAIGDVVPAATSGPDRYLEIA